MFNGEVRKVHIQFPNDRCGIFIDRFGKDIRFYPVDEDHSELIVDVAISNQFFGWIFALGKEVKVTAPEDVVDRMRIAAEEFAGNYQ